MKPKIARRILRRNHLAIVKGDHFSPSKQRELKEAIRVVVKAETGKGIERDPVKDAETLLRVFPKGVLKY